MPSSLSQADVDRLLVDSSVQPRVEVACKLGPSIDRSNLTDAELRSVQDIVRIMAQDVEEAVRAALSKSLRHSKRLPHDVALSLASDVESVALPILTHSPVLTDEDLVELIIRDSAVKQAAIAARPEVHDLCPRHWSCGATKPS